MPHWDHMCELAEDFAMAKLTLGDEEPARRYRSRRIVAVAFVPGLFLVLYLIALYINNR